MTANTDFPESVNATSTLPDAKGINSGVMYDPSILENLVSPTCKSPEVRYFSYLHIHPSVQSQQMLIWMTAIASLIISSSFPPLVCSALCTWEGAS